ncbi:MAG: LytTR family transcriptional regulator DNA-binding domain-containing protein [Bacillota bacterium]
MNEITEGLISVTKEIEGDITSILIRDILFGMYSGAIDRIIIHTQYKTYYLHSSLVYWANTLNNSGYNFIKADRYYLINVDNITRLNVKKRCVYFDVGLDGETKKCFLAYHKFETVRENLLCLNSNILLT